MKGGLSSSAIPPRTTLWADEPFRVALNKLGS
jgi:hypothetical protein